VNKAIMTILAGVACLCAIPAHAGPRAECAATGATLPCLDARLKQATQKLNATLKAAQERLEQMQAKGGRPMMGAFVDSQRKFNAYRDAQCSWQGVRAAPGENTAEYVRECQLVETVAREQLLARFASGAEPDAAAPTGGSIEVRPTEPQTDAVIAATPTQPETLDMPAPVVVEPSLPQGDVSASVPQPADAGKRGLEWHLASWITGGQQKVLLRDSSITIAFDPTGKVAGKAGINRFSGSYSFDDDGRLKWPPGGFTVTRMAGPPAMMAQERAFLESLRRTSRYKVDGQRLVLESANSSVVLTFTRDTP
jgi:heat shock protein HslJ/uncharacterized protein YecT (DUF1311 family)